MKLFTITDNAENAIKLPVGKGREYCLAVYREYDDMQLAAFKKQADQYICCVSVEISDWGYSESFFQRISLDTCDYVINNHELYGVYINHKQPFAGEGLLFADMSNSTYRHGWNNRGCNYDEYAECYLIPVPSVDFTFAVGDRYHKGSAEYSKLKAIIKDR